ncbi:MAG: hypothetical protein L3J03_02215 [Desulfobacterales bacterium]|nr:hypothetical protein [Desulfobacterales bacterium]
MPVSVYQWLRFVHSGLRSILVLFEQARMGEDEVLVNAYLQVLRLVRARAGWFNGRPPYSLSNPMRTKSNVTHRVARPPVEYTP